MGTEVEQEKRIEAREEIEGEGQGARVRRHGGRAREENRGKRGDRGGGAGSEREQEVD